MCLGTQELFPPRLTLQHSICRHVLVTPVTSLQPLPATSQHRQATAPAVKTTDPSSTEKETTTLGDVE